MTFWKFLTEAKFTGSPPKLTEDELKKMGRRLGCLNMRSGRCFEATWSF